MAPLEIEQQGRIRLLRLNRPERRNALNDELGWAIVAAVRAAQADAATAVLAITGNGSAFCSGLDLKAERDLAAHSGMNAEDVAIDDLRWISRFLLTIRNDCDKPVVAGVNGVAVGGGLALAMACDLRIMSSTATLATGYAGVGGAPDGGLSFTLSEAVGYEKALRLLLDTKAVTATDALTMGLVGEVVAPASFPARLIEYCESLAALSPLTLRLTKRSLRNATRHADLEGHLRYELANLLRAFDSDASKSARAAFTENSTRVDRG